MAEFSANDRFDDFLESEQYEHQRFVVDKGQALLRIDKYLVDKMNKKQIVYVCIAPKSLFN